MSDTAVTVKDRLDALGWALLELQARVTAAETQLQAQAACTAQLGGAVAELQSGPTGRMCGHCGTVGGA